MAVNHFFEQEFNAPEQNLVDSLIIESIQIHGRDMYYINREHINENVIFGEDENSLFKLAYKIECWTNTNEGFSGGDYLSNIGVEIRDEAVITLSKTRFQLITNMERPLEGDLIYYSPSKTFFEIKFVEHEKPFYQLGANYTFEISMTAFDYAHEDFQTGVPELDLIETTHKHEQDLTKEKQADNVVLETDADTNVIDFGENSPFGTF